MNFRIEPYTSKHNTLYRIIQQNGLVVSAGFGSERSASLFMENLNNLLKTELSFEAKSLEAFETFQKEQKEKFTNELEAYKLEIQAQIEEIKNQRTDLDISLVDSVFSLDSEFLFKVY